MVLPNATLFPHTILPLYIFEPRYRTMLADALSSHRLFSVALQRPDRVRETPSEVAGVGIIRASVQNKDGTSQMIVQGMKRIQLGKMIQSKPYRVHEIAVFQPNLLNPGIAEALMVKARELIKIIFDEGFYPGAELLKKLPANENDATMTAQATDSYQHFLRQIEQLQDPEIFVDAVGGTLLTSAAERQVLLETPEIDERLKHLVHFLLALIERARNTGAK
ncbi:MAG TPA: LON peptidase substrate-binding domain-containing protein [Verrucomicrobiae bacterium]